MVQNKSSAVMQQRFEPQGSLDDFPTPPWATRALCQKLLDRKHKLSQYTCFEPCANRGHMVKPLKEYFNEVKASDIHDYGFGFKVMDYLQSSTEEVDWTITNPPFKLAAEFIDKALTSSRKGVAMIVRTSFLEGVGRYNRLFSITPPSVVYQFSERVVMHKGVISKTGSTATSYCWMVWEIGNTNATELKWIGPCRRSLETEADYQG